MDLSTSTTVSKVNVSGSISITGGDVSKTKWADWSPTVAADPKPVMFTENGLVPVWTYCTSSTRASYLSAQFDDLYRLVTYGTAIRDEAPSPDRSTSSGVYTWSADADFKETLKAGDSKDALVVTGFGTRVNNDRHVTRIGIQVTDINSGNVITAPRGRFEVRSERLRGLRHGAHRYGHDRAGRPGEGLQPEQSPLYYRR